MSLPSGTLTFLFTDVEGSTRLLDALGSGFDALMEAHREILRSSVEHHHGTVFMTEGDAVFAIFIRAMDAVAAAEEGQRRLAEHRWPSGAEVRVRMAVHTGEARQVEGVYYGMPLHVAARVCAAGHGGQVLLTESAHYGVPECEVRQLGEHRLKDLADPVAILQLLGDDLVATFPPLRTLSAMPSNLPASVDAFVGRSHELAEVLDGLASHRLVTLTGAGGSGKTRLALEAAGRMLDSQRDGVWLVELASLSDPTRVAAQVAQVLGLGDRAGRPVDETLTTWLRSHEVLLILDNCEHLISAAADFVDLMLRSCPDLRILATSREMLGVRGELALVVPPLGLDGEAAEMFLIRADAFAPGFDSVVADLALVDQVCRRLDGLPLAIELAVARLRSLSLVELADRLDDRFRLLTGGSRAAPGRQRTLEAMVNWSYDLLSPAEAELFRTLSVFPDGFTIDAVASVSGSEDVDVVEGVGRLLEKSLIVRSDARTAANRFHMLETLRQYGRDRLEEHGELELRRDAMLRWAMCLVDRAEGDLSTPAMDAAMAAVMPERANVRSAMEWAIEQGELTAALRLVTVVPLDLTGRRRALMAELIERGGSEHPAAVVARAQQTLSDLSFEQGDWAAAASAGLAAWGAYEALGDRRRAVWAKHDYCTACWGAGDLATADRLLPEVLAEFRDLGDEYGIAQGVWHGSLREPDREKATAMAIEAERLYRQLGSPIMRAHALEGRGLVELEAGDLPSAAPFLRESVSILADSGNQGCTAHTLEAVAVWAAEHGDADVAGELVGAAEALRAASGAGHKPWEVRARHRGDYESEVLGDSESARAAVDRGRGHSLASAAALADGLLATSIRPQRGRCNEQRRFRGHTLEVEGRMRTPPPGLPG
jgi:predicted ATPase/class 3 adenylate cyclase